MENSPSSKPSSHPGILHAIPPNLSAFEPSKPLAHTPSIHTLLWIGGMFDTPGSVPYPFGLAQSLPPTWSLMTACLSSAGMSWGVKSIGTDARDMAKIVGYIREKRAGGKVVIMGHSTGCQDCMEYLVGQGSEARPGVDGVVLQAPCSDREAMEATLPREFKDEADRLARKMCRDGQDKDSLPHRLTGSSFGRMAITARRWLDISSPGPDHTGADDYFSSDLGVGRFRETFGRIPVRTPVLVLASGKDEFVPKEVDQEKLVNTWVEVMKESGKHVDEESSGSVKGASHAYKDDPDEVVQDMEKRVVGFLRKLDEGIFGGESAKI